MGRGAGKGLSPESFYESLHLLGFSLHADVRLKLSQGFIQLHVGKVHLIYHTAEGKQKGVVSDVSPCQLLWSWGGGEVGTPWRGEGTWLVSC